MGIPLDNVTLYGGLSSESTTLKHYFSRTYGKITHIQF